MYCNSLRIQSGDQVKNNSVTAVDAQHDKVNQERHGFLLHFVSFANGTRGDHVAFVYLFEALINVLHVRSIVVLKLFAE